MKPKNPQPYYFGAGEIIFEYALELRKPLTKAENILWQKLRNRKINGFKFRRQHPINRFIADFYCHEAKLIIELDGCIHDLPEIQERDRIKQDYIESKGLKMLRFKNEEVLFSIDVVLSKIKSELAEQK